MSLKSIVVSVILLYFCPLSYPFISQASDQEDRDEVFLSSTTPPVRNALIVKRKIPVIRRRSISLPSPVAALQDIFIYIDPRAFSRVVCVSKSWKAAKEEFWELMKIIIKEDYPQGIALSDKLIFTHLIRMNINTSTSRDLIESLIKPYPFIFSQPRVYYQDLIDNLVICHLTTTEENDLWATRGNPVAFQIMEEGLEKGDYDYEMNHLALVASIERGVQLRLPIAAEAKVIGLVNGSKGYQQSLPLAREFLMQVLSTPSEGEIAKVIKYVTEELTPEDEEHHDAHFATVSTPKLQMSVECNEDLIGQGNHETIYKKFTQMIHGNIADPSDLARIPSLLAALMQMNLRFAYALTAFGKLYGILGFDKDVEDAHFLFLQHKIAY